MRVAFLLLVGMSLAGVTVAGTAVVPIGPGSFVSYDDDGTAIAVTLSRPYLLATYAVTVGEYEAYLIDTTGAPSDTTQPPWWSATDGHVRVEWPAANVSFLDALRYANWLSARDGYSPAYDLADDEPIWRAGADGWRLPTEAEWQFAALCRDGCLAYQDEVSVGPVSAAPRNDLGLAGMVDDALEWCWDGFEPARRDSLIDPVGEDPAGRRVIRGLGPDTREWAGPGYRDEALGFRLARSVARTAALDSLLRRQDLEVARRRQAYVVEAVADSLYWSDRDRRDRVRRVGGTVGVAGGMAVFVGWSLFSDEERTEATQDAGLEIMAAGAGALLVGAIVYLAAGKDLSREESLAWSRELVGRPRGVGGTALGLRLAF